MTFAVKKHATFVPLPRLITRGWPLGYAAMPLLFWQRFSEQTFWANTYTSMILPQKKYGQLAQWHIMCLTLRLCTWDDGLDFVSWHWGWIPSGSLGSGKSRFMDDFPTKECGCPVPCLITHVYIYIVDVRKSCQRVKRKVGMAFDVFTRFFGTWKLWHRLAGHGKNPP